MNKEQAVKFLFTIATELKRSLEQPVILLTQKDYADCIYKCLLDIRSALLEQTTPKRVYDIVCKFHFQWLQAIQDVENFKRTALNTPRDVLYAAIEYTSQRVEKRLEYFQHYINHLKGTMTEVEKHLMKAELGELNDMKIIVNSALDDKLRTIRNQVDKDDFYITIMNEVEELMNWLDKLNDNLAIQFSKVLNIPLRLDDLSRTLQKTINEVTKTDDNKCLVEELSGPEHKCLNALNDLEIATVIEKIKVLEDRVNRLKINNSSAVMAIRHKTLFLEERLQSLENLKLSLNNLKNQRMMDERFEDSDNDVLRTFEYSIFNHLLPNNIRSKLVQNLIELWNNAINTKANKKSWISILSAENSKEIFRDDIGEFVIDQHGRKLYKKEDDDLWYQLNEDGDLVVVDDDERVYFYDDCGRYYINENRERIYKGHPEASEYILNRQGNMMKVCEVDGDMVYYYDHLGRYYKNEKGQHIYRDKNSTTEFISDGYGNLVRIREEINQYVTCPREPMVLEENLYLKQVVGDALKTCIAEIIAIQPFDPIGSLADRLENYRMNIQNKIIRQQQHNDLMAARKELKNLESISLETESHVSPEEIFHDFVLEHYESAVGELAEE